ncbi:hypothetical protein ACWEQL_00540 [Kitasatospora sp. NPDC004240]
MSRRHTLVCLPTARENDLSPALRRMLDQDPPEGRQAWQTFVFAELDRALRTVRREYVYWEATERRSLPLHQDAPADDPRIFLPSDGQCVGAPIGFLDLAGLREQRAAQAADLYDTWTRATADLPPAQPLSVLAEQHSDRTRAMLAFTAQPQLMALAEILGDQRYRCRYDGPAMVALNREQFTERARRRAVPGNSLLDRNGDWSTDPAWLNDDDVSETGSTRYHGHVNAYLDALPSDHLVVGVELRR